MLSQACHRNFPGARALVAKYATGVCYAVDTHRLRKQRGYSPCSKEFGVKVDFWLQQAVEHGWLDWGPVDVTGNWRRR